MQYNLFMYCNGDPVNNVDPSGHETTAEQALLCLAATLLIIAVIVTFIPTCGASGGALALAGGGAIGGGAAISATAVANTCVAGSAVATGTAAYMSYTNNNDNGNSNKSNDVDKRENSNQKALRDLAKEAERKAKAGKPISYEEARILDMWAEEYNVPQHHSAVLGSGEHYPGFNYFDHTHIYNIHVPFVQ